MLGRPTALVQAVDGVSFSVNAGETLAMVGESGSGKSTVGRLLLRLIDATAGSVRFAGRDVMVLSPAALRAFRREAQIIFQDPYASLNPRMTVAQMLAEPLALHGLVPPAGRAARIAELLGEETGATVVRHLLRLLDHDEPGFWERNGYHERGDPWAEQRYDGD